MLIGGIFLHASNNAFSAVQINFIQNNVVFDGAAVVIYATNYGYSLRNVVFSGNNAGRNGGTILLCLHMHVLYDVIHI